MGLVNILGSYVCQTSYDDLPEAVISSTKVRILDFLGVALSGYKHEVDKPILKVLEKYGRVNNSGAIGKDTKLPGDLATFVNSSIYFDMSDGSRAAGLHPGTVVIPATLAIAEDVSKTRAVSGQDLILAIALGYEVMVRVGRAMNPSAVKRGFHLTSIVGPLGAAAAAGKIINLDEASLSNALSIAAISGSGLLEAFKAPEPFTQIQIARACQSGIFSVLLAQSGVQGSDQILEKAFIPAFCDEYNLDLVKRDLGQDYMIPKTYIKMHAGCRHIHAPIDAALYIVSKHEIDWRDIEQIRVKIYSVALDLEIKAPKTGDEAKFNCPFGIAAALIYGNASIDKFTDQNLGNEQVQKLMSRVIMEHDPELDREYPAKRGATVEIATKGGKTFSHTLSLARGEPEYPYSRSEIEDKFEYLISGLIDRETSRKIIEFVNRLETIGEISSLFRWLKANKSPGTPRRSGELARVKSLEFNNIS